MNSLNIESETPSRKRRWIVGLIVFLLGVVGVLSMLTVDIPIPEEQMEMLNQMFSPTQIKILTLVNPTILMGLAVLLGTPLYHRIGLSLPIIERIVYGESKIEVSSMLKGGVVGGLIAGILLVLITIISTPFMPEAFLEAQENMELTLAARFLYGGIVEEIMMRFGMMTVVIWIGSKAVRGLTTPIVWIGILTSALLFALGHFPVVFSLVDQPTTSLLLYVLIGNSVGGIIFGWLYWKRGLEAAMIAHIMAHVVMVLSESFIQ